MTAPTVAASTMHRHDCRSSTWFSSPPTISSLGSGLDFRCGDPTSEFVGDFTREAFG